MRDLGGGVLYLCDRPFTKQLSGVRYQTIRPLLLSQPYIKDVRWHAGEKITHDFSTFRKTYGRNRTLAEIQARYVGAKPHGSVDRWLHVEAKPNDRVIIHRSPRYHNNLFPWSQVLKHFGAACLFVGPENEYRDFAGRFGEVEHTLPADFLVLARMIAGSRLFIGNQSSPYAVAEGLKHNTIQETSPRAQDCIFTRPNAQFVLKGRVALAGGDLIGSACYFSTVNATNIIRTAGAGQIQFTRTRFVAGSWHGVYETMDTAEIGRLQSLERQGITEISKADYQAAIAAHARGRTFTANAA